MAGRDPLIVVDIVVPEAELVRRLGTRLICEDCGANADAGRRGAAPDALRACGGRLVQRTDDNEAVVLRAAEGVPARDASRSSSTTARGRRSGRSTARSRPIAWRRISSAAIEAAGNGGGARAEARAVIVCRSAAELERMREAGRLVGEVLTELAAHGRAGRDDGGARRAGGEADSRRRARRRRSRGITGTRRRFARRSTTR